MTPMLWYFFISVVVAVVVFFIALQKRYAPKSLYFILLSTLLVLFVLGRFLEASASTLEAAYIGVILAYLGAPHVPLVILEFLLDYYDFKMPRWLSLIMTMPALAASLMVAAPQLRGLIYSSISFFPGPPIAQIMIEGTFFYYFLQAYGSLMMIACLVLSMWGIKKHGKSEQKQSMALFLSILLPLATNAMYLLGMIPLDLEVTPLAMCFSLIFLSMAIYRYNLLKALPMARDYILEQMSDAIIILDTESRYIECNISAKRIIPALKNIRFGQKVDIRVLLPGLAEDATEEQTVTLRTAEKQRQYYTLTNTSIMQDGKKLCTCYTLHDITAMRRMLAELRTMATYDNLTNIYNRASFYKLAEYEIDMALEQKSPVAVFEIDIDHFKTVNDTYGHLGGDEILKALVIRISSRLRDSDIFGRVGGEEFNILMPNTKLENAKKAAQRIKTLIERMPFEFNGREINVTISIGVAMFDAQRHTDIERLFRDADTALYRAKNTGRNRVCVYGGE